MRRTSIVLTVVLGVLANLLATGAGAKGAVEANINGPGIGGGGKGGGGGGGIHLGPGKATQLAEETGLYNMESIEFYADENAPAKKYLGPRYVLTLQVDWGRGEAQKIVQYLYPYSPTGPWVFTPRQLWLDNQTEMGPLWYTRSKTMAAFLVDNGLPKESPVAIPKPPDIEAEEVPGAEGAEAPAPKAAEAPVANESSQSTPWLLLTAVGLVLAAGGAIVLARGSRLRWQR
jgi:hypothetical protein